MGNSNHGWCLFLFTLFPGLHLNLPLVFDIYCKIENISHFTKHFTSAFNSSVLLKVHVIWCKVQRGDKFGKKM